MQGRIIKVIAGYYDVLVGDQIFRVRGSGKLRNNEETPLVGDIVTFTPDEFIEKIEERKNSLVRPRVANIDQAAIVVSTTEPKYNSLFLNKLLSVIEYNDIEPILIFTKSDLLEIEAPESYKKDGYSVFKINNNKKETLMPLKDIFRHKLTVFTGFSGSGKSSTISNLTNTEREVQEISQFLQRGKHTTRVVEIIRWNKGMLIDSPGFSSFETSLTEKQLARSFKDFKELRKTCKFKDCLHNQEKVCAVKEAVRNDMLSLERYNDYLRMLKELKNDK